MARKQTDWTLFFTVMMMTCIGLIMVYSATSVTAALRGGDMEASFLRQLFAALISFFLLMWLKRQNYLLLKDPMWAFIPLGLVLASLPIAYFMDGRTHRWIRTPLIQLQPSEFAKPALIVFVAYFLTRRMAAINSRYTLLPAAMTLAVLSGVVLVSDLGTSIALVLPVIALLYVAGIRKRYLLGAAGVALLVMTVGVAVKPYRMARVIAFVDPDYNVISKIDPNGWLKGYVSNSTSTTDPNYQINQAKIAVGSGGALGLGIMGGRQKMLFLPEAHTDCIYAVVGEELGLWGASALLGGYFVIFWRGFRLFWLAKEDFGRFLALGISISLLVQALINISVVLGMGPAKGIPLPLISYGGSSLMSTLISLGILMSVSEDAQWLESAS
ncbi:FtsW/RodA/SpoVE family cell cycle protein [Bryobacter aggregatus]|uniref:FtsW/RodA/SpoVE family cell cycle protein n=1 Tax=Bryobacter aggregatus TaxID=360054 RepID=UPI0004E16FE2|nr:putative peptidoglycan glycosyltransferase FtsW [Bryobacter aggregatus]